MIHLIFISFLISGFVCEINDITRKESSTSALLLYALGSVLFLFWEEEYISHPLIIILSILSVINYITEKENSKAHKLFKQIDPYLSLACLLFLTLHYTVQLCCPS